jgi:hypothetical protein
LKDTIGRVGRRKQKLKKSEFNVKGSTWEFEIDKSATYGVVKGNCLLTQTLRFGSKRKKIWGLK